MAVTSHGFSSTSHERTVAKKDEQANVQELKDPIFVQGLASYQTQNVAAFWGYFLNALRKYYYYKTLMPLQITPLEAEELARNLAQDVVIKVHTKLYLFAGWNRGQIMGYVFRAAARRERRYLKTERKKRRISLAQLMAAAPWIGPATIVNQNGEVVEVASHPLKADPSQRVLESIYVRDALLKLDKRERTVLLLREVLELSVADVA